MPNSPSRPISPESTLPASVADAFAGFFEQAPVAMQLFSEQGFSVATNAAFRALFGSSPPPGYNILQDEIACERGIDAAIARAFHGETVNLAPFWHDPRELRHVSVGTGGRIAVAMSLFPIPGQGGQRHIGAMFRDATASLTVAESVKDLLPRQGLLRIGTWRLELGRGALEDRQLFWSDETFRLFGYTPGEIALDGETLFKHAPAEDHPSIRSASQRAIKEGGDYAVEHRIVRADGQVRLVHEHGVVERETGTGRAMRIHGTVQDITDLAVSERRLMERSQLLVATMEGADAQVFSLDRDLRYIGFNEQHAHFMRAAWGVEISTGLDFLSPSRPPEHAERLVAMAARVLAGETLRVAFEPRAWVGPHLQWLVSSWTPIRDAAGAVTGIAGFTLDQSEVHRAEERFRLLFEAAPVPMLLVDAQGAINLANSAAQLLFGYGRHEWAGKSVEDLVPARYRAGHPKLREAFTHAASSRQIGAGRDLYAVCRDGREVAAEVAVSPVVTTEGTFYACGIVDVSERKRAEAVMRDLNASLEALAAERTSALQRALAIQTTLSEGAPEPIWLHEPGKGVTYVNRRWCEIFGRRPRDWLGDAWKSLLHPEDAPTYLAFWKDATEQGEPFHAEARFRDSTGSMRSFDVKCAPVREPDGSILAWVGINTDITPRKRNEEALRQANRELESFSYSVSHDLRAPLRAIDGFSRILLEESSAVLDERSRGYLDRVRRSATQMGVLIDDLLEFSRLGRRELRLTTVDHGALVATVLENFEAELAGRQIEWRIGSLPAGRGDPGLLRQVWTNLLSNAVKFTCTRSPAVIEVGAEPGDGGTTYFVRDNGVGFDMQYAGRLFGVFQRLHRAEEFPGTGVGLAIVSRIIERHGGSVNAEAVLNEGACFRFTLPDTPAQPVRLVPD